MIHKLFPSSISFFGMNRINKEIHENECINGAVFFVVAVWTCFCCVYGISGVGALY